jgi:hypothetical protein
MARNINWVKKSLAQRREDAKKKKRALLIPWRLCARFLKVALSQATGMSSFDPACYGSVIAGLLREKHLMPLGPGKPNQSIQSQLAALTPQTAFEPLAIRDQNMASACLAGLWLYHNFLDESHRISQEIETSTGSYWHGILHRREPDYANAKYWFRKVGDHPIYKPLTAAAAEIAASAEAHPSAALLAKQSNWDPFAFIDLCEASLTGSSPCEMFCRQVQQKEWELLFDYCYRKATEGD